ncbi:MAG: methyltransferase domain-containing protein [Cyanobacteria bacterium SZAS-4]|nr:methyltransferase domain-containing protein [Cyanobacteria bacterium SZAS-4]
MTSSDLTAPTDQTASRKDYIELFMLSAASLFFELLIIRWLSADFMAFSVFKTFPLVTCYVGLGVGFAAARTKNYLNMAPLAILQLVAFMLLSKAVGFNTFMFPSVSVYQWFKTDTLLHGQVMWVYVSLFILVLIVVLSGPFAAMACLGSRLGQLFAKIPALNAYATDIAGAVFGSILFSILSFLGFAPWMLLTPVLLLIGYLAEAKWWQKAVPIALTLVLAGWVIARPGEVFLWSPYQKLSVMSFTAGDTPSDIELAKKQGIVIGTNGMFYQYALNLSKENLETPEMTTQVRNELLSHSRHYNLPYKLKEGKSVLILGAGSGNDVAAALRNGADHVDAVDIDPVILKLGDTRHPERPYDSPKVHQVCDDARDFLNRTTSKYDLIIFAGLDSHTISGQGGSMRLDNYVYTKQSMQRALQLLKPDGLMIVSFCKSTAWLSHRLHSTIEEAAGYAPITVLDETNPSLSWEIFITGPLVHDGLLKIDPAAIVPFVIQKPSNLGPTRILTDDWPFIYVSPVGVDVPYLIVVAAVLLLSIYAARRILFAPTDRSSWQMFFLGAAFLLLELQSIARLSLLYGSTWYTSAIVINSVLLMILGANFLVIKGSKVLAPKITLIYVALFLSLIGSACLPVRQILEQFNGFSGQAIVSFLTVLPMMIAGIIFSLSFKKAPQPDKAFAFNLLGAVAGAMFEYASNYVGINSLVWIATTLYLVSFFFCVRTKQNG